MSTFCLFQVQFSLGVQNNVRPDTPLLLVPQCQKQRKFPLLAVC